MIQVLLSKQSVQNNYTCGSSIVAHVNFKPNQLNRFSDKYEEPGVDLAFDMPE